MTFSDWVEKWISQISHVGWGAFLTVALALHLPARHAAWEAALVVLTFATLKEGVFDPLTETIAEQGSGIEDWAFWILGIGLGVAVFLV